MEYQYRHYRADDHERIVFLRREAFRHGPRPAPFERGGGRVLTHAGEVVAALVLEPAGQFFGGRSLPMVGVTSVMVDPRFRGRGLVSALLRETLAERREAGVMLSMLYPSLLAVYRKAGYEIAGAWNRWSLPIASLPAGVPDDSDAIEPWDHSDDAEVAACYRDWAAGQNGAVDRPAHWWTERVIDPLFDTHPYHYLTRRDGRVTGYITYLHEQRPGIHGYAFALVARDLVWTDAQAARSLLAFVAANRQFGIDFSWPGPVEEPLALLLASEEPLASDRFLWMLRLLDVPAALTGRGYPPAVQADLAFTLRDPVLPANAGSWRLSVEDGMGRLEPVQAADLCIDAHTLAAMYSGWLPAREAARAGRLPGATRGDLQTLELIFHGPKPWMVEAF